MLDCVAVGAAARLARLFQTAAVNIVEPAVIEATQPTVFDAAVAQIRAAMRAMQSEQADPPLIVAKQSQRLAKNLDA